MKNRPIKPLGEVAEFINGRAFKPSDWSSKGVPIIRIQNLTDPSAFANRFGGTFEERHHVRNGDLLVSWSATLDVFVWDRGDAILNQHIFRVVPNISLVSKAYLFYALKSVMDELRSKTHGATMKHITKGPFERTEILVPSLPEQERIVKLLNDATELRELRAEAVSRMAGLIPALFHNMFGDPISNSMGWSLPNIEQVCTRVTDGTHDTPAYVSAGIPLVTSKNLRAGSIELSNIQYISRADHEVIIRRSHAEAGDILFAMIGTIGNAAIVPNDVEISIKNVGLFKPNPSIIVTEYLHAFLCYPSFVTQLLASAKGGTQKFVGLGMLRSINVPLPPLPLQKEFAKRVKEIHELKGEQAASRRRLDDLFQSTLHRAFNSEFYI
jgi:type I restriction enzyme S subunit